MHTADICIYRDIFDMKCVCNIIFYIIFHYLFSILFSNIIFHTWNVYWYGICMLLHIISRRAGSAKQAHSRDKIQVSLLYIKRDLFCIKRDLSIQFQKRPVQYQKRPVLYQNKLTRVTKSRSLQNIFTKYKYLF